MSCLSGEILISCIASPGKAEICMKLYEELPPVFRWYCDECVGLGEAVISMMVYADCRNLNEGRSQ